MFRYTAIDEHGYSRIAGDGGRRDFSFDPPKRINGISDHESYKKYKTYAETYRAEKAAATPL